MSLSEEAESLLRRGLPMEAARLFREAGLDVRAVEALSTAGKTEEAARLALQLGEAERALELAARAESLTLMSAAESALLLRREGSATGVARMLLRLGRPVRAAELLLLGGEAKAGAQIFEQIGLRDRAALAFLAAGEPLRASQLWKRHLDERPDDLEARLGLAGFLLQGGQEREAVACLQAALRFASPPDPRLATDEGWTRVASLAVVGLERLGLRQAAAKLRRVWPKIEAFPVPQVSGLGSIGRYELQELAGEGANALVYRALDRWSGQTVALKRLRGDREESPEPLRRFLLEARLTARLKHPNLVKVLETDEVGGFLTMEWMAGGTLAQRMEGPPLPLPEVRRLLTEALAGLECAHFEGIIHRDLKPGNLLLDADGTLRLADFGVAHVLDSSWTRSGAVVGTYGYLAPEQLLGLPVHPATDLYALGIVLYQLICGRPPFTGKNLLRDYLERQVPWPQRMGSPVSESLGRTMLLLLAKDPGDRPASAKAASDLLQLADWSLEEAAIRQPWPGLEPQTPIQAEAQSASIQRSLLVEEGFDELGTWQRLEDPWLGRRRLERRYADTCKAAPILQAVCRAQHGRLPVLLACVPEQGAVSWLEILPPEVPVLQPRPDCEFSRLLDEVAALLGQAPQSLPDFHHWSPFLAVLPDRTCLLTSLDPLIRS